MTLKKARKVLSALGYPEGNGPRRESAQTLALRAMARRKQADIALYGRDSVERRDGKRRIAAFQAFL